MAHPEKTNDQEGNYEMVNAEESNVGKEARLSTENNPGSRAQNKQHTAFEKNKKKTNLKKINEEENKVKDDLGKISKGKMKGMVAAELSEREPPIGKGGGRGLELKPERQGERKGKRQDEGKSARKGKRQRERLTNQHASTQNAATQGIPNGTNSEHHQGNLSNETPSSCSIASNVDQKTSRTYIRREQTKLATSSNEQIKREEQNDAQDQGCSHDDERKENSILRNRKLLKCAGREKNDVIESTYNGHYMERYTSCCASNMDRKETGNVDSGENNPVYVKRPYFEPNFFNQRIMKNSNIIPSFDKYSPYEKKCADHMDGRNMYQSSAETNSVVNGGNSSANNNSDCSNYGYVNIVPPPDGLGNHHSYHPQKQQVEYQEEEVEYKEQQLSGYSNKAQIHISFIPQSGRSEKDLPMNTANVQHHQIVPPYVHPLGNKEQGIRNGAYPKDRYYIKGKEKIHDQYYRIKLCPFLKKGLCQKGDNCSYAHLADTLRSCMNLMKTKICQLWLRNECRNANCVFAHGEGELRATPDYFKTKLCKYFDKEGTCPSGDKCRHAHGQAELRQRNYRKTELEKISPKSKISTKFIFHDLKNKGECPQYILNMLSGRSRKENVDRSDWNNWNQTNGHNGVSNVFNSEFSNRSRYHRDTRVATPNDENSNAPTTSADKRAVIPDQMWRPEKRDSTGETTQVYHVSASQSCTNQEKEIHAVLTVCERKEKSDGAKNRNGSSANVCDANYCDKREAPGEEQNFKTEARQEADQENASHEDTPNLHHTVWGTTSSISLECAGNAKKEQRGNLVERSMGNNIGNGTGNERGNGESEASKPEQRAENQKERKCTSPGDEPLSEKNQNLAHRRESVEMENEEIELDPNEEQHPVGKASYIGDINDGDYKMLREETSGGEKKDGTFAEVLDNSSQYTPSERSSSQYMSIGRSSSEGEVQSCGNRSPNKSYGGCNQNCQGERRGQAEDENNGHMANESKGIALFEVDIEKEDNKKYESVEIGNALVEADPQARRSETRRSFEGDKNEDGNVDRAENGDEDANGRGGNEKQRYHDQEQERPTLNEYRCTRPTNEMDNCLKMVNSGESIMQRRYGNNCPREGERYDSFRNFKENGNDIQRNPIFMLKNQYRKDKVGRENDGKMNSGNNKDAKDNDRKKNPVLSKLARYPTASTYNNYGPKNFNCRYKKINMASRYAKNLQGVDHYRSVANYGVGGNVASYGNCDRHNLSSGGELIKNEGMQDDGVIGGNGSGRGNAPEAREKKGDTQGEHSQLSDHNKVGDLSKNGDHTESKEQMTNGRVKTRGEDKNCNDNLHRNFPCKNSQRSFNNTYSTPEQNPSDQNFENASRCSHTNHNHVNNSLHMQNVLPRPRETYSNVCNSGAHRTKQNYDKSNGNTRNDMLYGPPVYPLNTLVNNFSYYNYNVSNVYSNRNNCYSYLNVELNSVNMASQTRVLPAELSISAQVGGTTAEGCRGEKQAANTTDAPNARNNRAHHSTSAEAANGQSILGAVPPITLRSTNQTHNRSAKSHPCSNQHRKNFLNIQNVGINAANMHSGENQHANAQGNNNRQERNGTSYNVAGGSSHHRSSVTKSNTNDNCVQNGNSVSSSAWNMALNNRWDPTVHSLSGNNNSAHGVSDENDLSGDNIGGGPSGSSIQNGGRDQIDCSSRNGGSGLMDRRGQNGGSDSDGENPNLHETQVSQNGGREKRKRNPHLPYSSHRNYERRTNNAHFKNYRNYNNPVYTNQVCTNQVYSNHVYANHPAYGHNQAYYSNQIYMYQHPYSNYKYNSGRNAYSNNSHPYNTSNSAYVIYPYSSYPYSISYHHSSNYPYDGLYTYDGEYSYGGAYPYDGVYPHETVQPYNSVNPYNISPHCDSVQPYGSAPHYSSNHYYGDVEQFSGGQLYRGGQLYSAGQVYIDVQPYGGDQHYNGNQSGVYNGSYTNDQSYVNNQYPYNASMNYGSPYNSKDTEEGQSGNRAPHRDSLLDSEEYQNRPNKDGNNANDMCQDESAFDDPTKNASTEEGEEEEGDEAAQQSPLQSPAEFQQ
ncbi:hypothetical protein C922_02342 [Plasmodium inui San Antonio 1]|uniref:C3H1-type domain-containing protein n=1 Tax=Plasmodium inui San Antonio 1 TaxID=1237626 RepID=W7A1V5_9APIC|nr:hypothetical protein C922_02342 [Plasmodium inui San Antonio 1]EUD67192.1 hypothetical protein C922_02342 [Plasmodium inui San Antonio 1]